MGQSTEELSGEIASTRESLASDLDALQDRVSPGAIVERRKQAARSRVGGIKDKVMGTAQSAKDSVTGTAHGAASSTHGAVSSAQDAVGGTQDRVQDRVQGSPLGAGLVAFGAGMVIAALMPASEKETRAGAQLVDTAREQAQPLVEHAKATGQEVGQHLADSASQGAGEVKDAAAEGAGKVQSEGRSAAESVQSEVKGG
jgi:hypothetical protein